MGGNCDNIQGSYNHSHSYLPSSEQAGCSRKQLWEGKDCCAERCHCFCLAAASIQLIPSFGCGNTDSFFWDRIPDQDQKSYRKQDCQHAEFDNFGKVPADNPFCLLPLLFQNTKCACNFCCDYFERQA